MTAEIIALAYSPEHGHQSIGYIRGKSKQDIKTKYLSDASRDIAPYLINRELYDFEIQLELDLDK